MSKFVYFVYCTTCICEC